MGATEMKILPFGDDRCTHTQIMSKFVPSAFGTGEHLILLLGSQATY